MMRDSCSIEGVSNSMLFTSEAGDAIGCAPPSLPYRERGLFCRLHCCT
jgi:hypothetical protein